jgi:hypothetical protein
VCQVHRDQMECPKCWYPFGLMEIWLHVRTRSLRVVESKCT